MRLRRQFPFGLALALLLPLAGRATTVEAPEFKELLSQSDYVVRGVVTSIDSEWRQTDDGRSYIASQVAIEVHDVLRGTPPATVVLQMVGGRVGEDELVVEGAPKLRLGEESIFFVQGNGRLFLPLTGLMHGVYPILHNFQGGADYVLRSNGMPLYSEQDISLPMSRVSKVKVKNPAARPLTAAAFSQLVRHVPVTANQPALEH